MRDSFGGEVRGPSQNLLKLLLAVLSVVAGLWIVTMGLWWRASHNEVQIASLSQDARQELVTELLEQSPGVFQWSWYAPEIGYTLTRNAELEAWGSRFRANRLGYRTQPPEKSEGTYRVVFLGDSWTFGMGVEQSESYPEVFAALANERGIAERYEAERVEAWTLALPGYNTFNFVEAFWYHFELLKPDLVVVGISANDNHSTHAVLPNGSSTKSVVREDQFGDPHAVIYGARSIDSFRYDQRWRTSFDLLRQLEVRLEALEVPVFHLFVGRARDLPMRARAERAGLEAPYVVVPLERTKGRWANDSFGHGTPEANELYASYVYENVATTLGWPRLEKTPELYVRHVQEPVSGLGSHGGLDVKTEEEGPQPTRLAAQGSLWASYAAEARETSRDLFPTVYDPAASRKRISRLQSLGALEPESGLLGRAGTVLVRRPDEGAEWLQVRYRALDDAPSLYPLEFAVSVPSAQDPLGNIQVSAVVEAGGSGALRVPVPQNEYSVLDVQLRASRLSDGNAQRRAAALIIESIGFDSGR